MKRYYIPFQFVFFLSLFVLILFQHFNSFSQTVASDTNQVKTMIDSCNAHGDLQCGENLLKLIRLRLPEVKNGKEKIFYQKAEIKTLRSIGNVYSDLSNMSKAMEYYQISRKKAEEAGDKLGLA